nr:4529_t:CDS:2 [Entrophospora candida]
MVVSVDNDDMLEDSENENHNFSLTTSTQSIASHLTQHHQVNENTSPDTITTCFGSAKNSHPTIKALFENNDKQPYNKKKQEDLTPKFKVPAISTVKQLIFKGYQVGRNKLQELLENSADSISFTTDEWTSMHKPYIGITIHWVSEDFELNQLLLTLEELPYPHTANDIVNKLEAIFDEYKIQNKIIAGVSDNSANVVAAMKHFGNIEHVRCAAHTIQISVEKGFKSIETFIKKVRRLNKFAVNRDKYREKLREIQQNICKLSKVIDLIDGYNVDASLEFIDLDNQIKILEPIKDVPTCWNSTYEGASEYGKKLNELLLNENEWLSLKELLKLLKKFAEATELLGGNKYPTLSLTYPVIINYLNI